MVKKTTWLSMLTLAMTVGCFDPQTISQIPFDSETWKSAQELESNNNLRSQMVDDLIKKEIIVGVSQEKIIDLLGVPDIDNEVDGFDIVYLVGRDRGFGIDFEWLGVTFGPGEKSTTVELITR